MGASYALSLAVRDSAKARRIIESPWYQARWGHVYQLAGDQNAKSHYLNNRGGHRFSTAVGAAATGAGASTIICDDPHGANQATSTRQRETTLEWWDQTMSTRLNDPKTGRKVIIMQRLHEKDLSGHVLAQGGYEHLCLPAEYEGKKIFTSIGWSDPRSEEGELLWPDQFGRTEIESLKTQLGTYGAAGQLQQSPVPAGGGIFKRQWWRFYKKHELPGFLDIIIQSWDMAFKSKDTSDYVVGQVWGRKDGNFYLLYQDKDRRDFVESANAVIRMSYRYPKARVKLIEDKANGPAIISALQNKVPGLLPVEPQGSKEARAYAVSPLVEAGNVYLPDPNEPGMEEELLWVKDFITTCERFPKVEFDDEIDAFTQGLFYLSENNYASQDKGAMELLANLKFR
jgi:predicted phage terminase large subunit-like protein